MTLFRSLNLAVALSLLSLPAVMKAQSVTTVPVGYTTIVVPPNSTQAISVPLDNLPDYQGVISARNGTTVSVSGGNWTSTTFGPYASKPYVLRFLTGASRGRQLKVVSNTISALTVSLPSGTTDIASIAAVGDSFELLPCDTLGSFFGSGGSTGVVGNANPSLADNVMVRGSAGWLTFYNDGNHWFQIAGDETSQDSFALTSESGILYIRRGTASLSITVSGQVPTTNLLSDFAAGSTNLFANRFPVDLSLNALGLQNLPNWLKGSNPNLVDNLWIKTTAGWSTYYHDGSNWMQVAGDDTPQNPVIKFGSSVLIVRRGAESITLNQVIPYNL